MSCCHADFAAVEGSDRGFTVGMPTFTFGPGVLAEAGERARELGLSRVALFTDPRLASSEYVAIVKASLAAAGVDATIYSEVAVEPTDASFQEATRFAADGKFDGYVSVGGGSVMDTCKAANLYASQPAEFMTYVNAPIGAGQKVPGPVKPHIACPTTSGTGSETTGIAIFALRVDQREDRHHFAAPDSRCRADRPDGDGDAAEDRGRRDRLRLHEPRARIADRAPVSSPPQSVERRRTGPVSQGANPFSDMLATEALRIVGRSLVRAVNDASRHRGTHGNDLRGDARGNRVQRRRLSPAARVVLRGVGADAELARRRLSGRQDAGAARHGGRAQQPFGLALHGALVVPSGTCTARSASVPKRAARRTPMQARCSRGRVIELMRATAMPNGLTALGFDASHLDALATGAEPQYRVIRNAPKDVGRDDLKSLFRAALSYW